MQHVSTIKNSSNQLFRYIGSSICQVSLSFLKPVFYSHNTQNFPVRCSVSSQTGLLLFKNENIYIIFTIPGCGSYNELQLHFCSAKQKFQLTKTFFRLILNLKKYHICRIYQLLKILQTSFFVTLALQYVKEAFLDLSRCSSPSN